MKFLREFYFRELSGDSRKLNTAKIIFRQKKKNPQKFNPFLCITVCCVALSCNGRLKAFITQRTQTKCEENTKPLVTTFLCSSAKREIPDRKLPKIRENFFSTVKSEIQIRENFFPRNVQSSIGEI